MAAPAAESDVQSLIVVNPAAARGRGEGRFRKVATDLAAWCAGEVRLTEARGDAARLAAAAARSGVGLVVVVGGDGTVHEVVNGLLAGGSFSGTLAYLPTGTGCDLARSLGLPASPAQAVRALAAARPRRIDVARVCAAGGVVRYFVNAANVGLGPRTAARIERFKTLGRFAYGAATAWELLRGQLDALALRHAGGTIDAPTLNISICNGPFFGGGMSPDPAASLHSGTLHVVHAGALGRAQALWLLPRLMRGTLGNHPQLRRFVAGRLEILGAGEIEADGEIIGALPATFEVLPAALNVLAPPASH